MSLPSRAKVISGEPEVSISPREIYRSKGRIKQVLYSSSLCKHFWVTVQEPSSQ